MLFKNITILDENYIAQNNVYLQTQGSEIVYIGKVAPEGYTGEVYGGENKVAVPGFFNAHCHVPMVMLRGHGEGLPLDRWLHEKVFPFESLLDSKDMYWGGLLGIAEMIASGGVSFSDMYMKLEHLCKAVDETGIKANLSNSYTSGADSNAGINDVVGNSDTFAVLEYIKTAGHDRLVCDMGIHSEYTTNEPLVKDIVAFAREKNLRIQLHLSETQKEHEGCKARRGKTPAKYFEDLGVFELPTTAAHCVWIEGDDFEILARNKVTAAHCPSSNLKLGSGIAKVRKMLESGINVAIGTDGASSNNNLNVLEEVTLAAMVQKGINQDPLFLSNADVFRLACENGARSQGRNDCGSIKVGNRADIVVYDLDRPHMQPVVDVASNVLYSAQSSDIVLSMIDGMVVYKNGEFKTLDIEQAMHNVKRITGEKLTQL